MGAIQGRQRDLRIRNRMYLAVQPRAAAADCRLGMALGTTITVKGRTQANAGLDRARYRINLGKYGLGCCEKSGRIGVQGADGTAGSRGAAAWSGIRLGLE